MAEDLVDHQRIFDRSNDLQIAAAVGTVLDAKAKDPLEQSRPNFYADFFSTQESQRLGLRWKAFTGGLGRFDYQLGGASTPWNRIRCRRKRGRRVRQALYEIQRLRNLHGSSPHYSVETQHDCDRSLSLQGSQECLS